MILYNHRKQKHFGHKGKYSYLIMDLKGEETIINLSDTNGHFITVSEEI